MPRTTAATSRTSTMSSSGCRVRSARAISCRRRRTRRRRSPPSRPPSSRLSPTSPSTSRTTASRARLRICTAPSAGSETTATPCVALASATTGRRPMRRGRSVNTTPRCQSSPSIRSCAASMTSVPAPPRAGQLVGHDRDLPPHLGGNPGCELARELLGEFPAEFLGDPGGGHQAEPDRRLVASRRGGVDERLSDRGCVLCRTLYRGGRLPPPQPEGIRAR